MDSVRQKGTTHVALPVVSYRCNCFWVVLRLYFGLGLRKLNAAHPGPQKTDVGAKGAIRGA